LRLGFAALSREIAVVPVLGRGELQHGVPQQPIRFGLIASAFGFEPRDDIGIQAHGDGLFCWTIKLADCG